MRLNASCSLLIGILQTLLKPSKRSSIWFAKPGTVQSVMSPSLPFPGRSVPFSLHCQFVSYLGGTVRREPPCRFRLAKTSQAWGLRCIWSYPLFPAFPPCHLPRPRVTQYLLTAPSLTRSCPTLAGLSFL